MLTGGQKGCDSASLGDGDGQFAVLLRAPPGCRMWCSQLPWPALTAVLTTMDNDVRALGAYAPPPPGAMSLSPEALRVPDRLGRRSEPDQLRAGKRPSHFRPPPPGRARQSSSFSARCGETCLSALSSCAALEALQRAHHRAPPCRTQPPSPRSRSSRAAPRTCRSPAGAANTKRWGSGTAAAAAGEGCEQAGPSDKGAGAGGTRRSGP